MIAHVMEENKLVQIQSFRFEQGYYTGMSQPAVLFSLRFLRSQINASAIRRFDELRIQTVGDGSQIEVSTLMPTAVTTHPILGRMLGFTLELLGLMKMPIMSGVQASRLLHPSEQLWELALPAVSKHIEAPHAAFRLTCWLINNLSQGVDVDTEIINTHVNKLKSQYQRLAPSGTNTLRFLKAAHSLGIPWRHIANNVYQFGWGSRSRWMDSSFTDRTSNISSALARDKIACIKVLREAGLPVPEHKLVSTAKQAVDTANLFGYPVVVKPANLDGGRGVFAGLRSAESVEKAFEAVSKLSPYVLVETFIQGDDHRLQVFEGQVFWVVRRSPAQVIGDGVHSVAQLVELINIHRAKQSNATDDDPMAEVGSASITLDDEAHDWLSNQGLSLRSVPAAGQSVRLRGAANVAQGGTREGVSLDKVHADNLALAAKAAAVLRLDLAGIDLLVPDITRSWRETGGGICEVNAQPQMARHLPEQLLPRLVPRRGRIPVIGMMVPYKQWGEHRALQQTLSDVGIQLRCVQSSAGCYQALGDSHVDAVIWQMDDTDQPFASMPVDIMDALFVMDKNREVSFHHRAKRVFCAETVPTNGSTLAVADLAEHIAKLLIDSLSTAEENNVDNR